ncbi:MAG TPA: hypothetical protein VMI06_14360 [Terriglobia bacterium]|nr:hypothetical protein [Terriglobia bacterium]
MDLTPYIYGWVLLAIVVAGLAIYRQGLARHNGEALHLANKEAALLTGQAIVGRRLRRIDFWGQWLTVVALLYAIALLDTYLNSVWAAGAGMTAR